MNRRMTNTVRRLLRLPLAAKLAGANALLLLVALGGFRGAYRGPADWPALAVAGAVLVVGVAVNVALVTLALRPLHDLHTTAQRVSLGDLEARVPNSLVADAELERVSSTFNLLLDRVMAERLRIRELAAQAIRAGDRERAALASELHDSTAQSIAAISYQLIAAERSSKDPELTARLVAVREATNRILEQVRLLSHTVYPRILDDLGLASALRQLARSVTVDIGPDIRVDVTDFAESNAKRLPADSAAVLYRVAQEAISNAMRHSKAAHIVVRLDGSLSGFTLEVQDDGVGFDPDAAEHGAFGLGLFTARERVSLAQGRFDLVTRPGSGTTVTASIPAMLATAASRRASH
ncbi:MAG TPA: sensor histidine kinase [Gemmatimonadaceae bacterium]|nr:sensor histidine kinase [Gemmatimonadaceae bacterium]